MIITPVSILGLYYLYAYFNICSRTLTNVDFFKKVVRNRAFLLE